MKPTDPSVENPSRVFEDADASADASERMWASVGDSSVRLRLGRYGEISDLSILTECNGHLHPVFDRYSIEYSYRVGGNLTVSRLPHHRTYGSVYGGSECVRRTLFTPRLAKTQQLVESKIVGIQCLSQ